MLLIKFLTKHQVIFILRLSYILKSAHVSFNMIKTILLTCRVGVLEEVQWGDFVTVREGPPTES